MCPPSTPSSSPTPKNSPVDTVQAVGRALRQAPGADKRPRRPVYLTPGEDPDDLRRGRLHPAVAHRAGPARPLTTRLDARLADHVPPAHHAARRPRSPAALRPPHPDRGSRTRPVPAGTGPQERRMAPRPHRSPPLPPHPPPPRRPPDLRRPGTATPWAAGRPGSATSTPAAHSTRPAPTPWNASASSGTPASRPSTAAWPTPPPTQPATATSPSPSTRPTTPTRWGAG